MGLKDGNLKTIVKITRKTIKVALSYFFYEKKEYLFSQKQIIRIVIFGGAIMKKIAVERSLQNVKDYLSENGYQVVALEEEKDYLNSFDAVIVSGQESHFLGMQDNWTHKSVISAKGRTVEEIKNELDQRLM